MKYLEIQEVNNHYRNNNHNNNHYRNNNHNNNHNHNNINL